MVDINRGPSVLYVRFVSLSFAHYCEILSVSRVSLLQLLSTDPKSVNFSRILSKHEDTVTRKG